MPCQGWKWLPLLIAALPGCSGRTDQGPVWLGQVAPASGPERQIGERARQGVLLAVERGREENWSVDGRPLAFRHADASDLEAVRAQTVRLIAVNRVSALLAPPRWREAAALVQAARPYGAICVIPGTLPSELAREGFTLSPPASRRGALLARYVRDDRKLGAAAILHVGDDALADELAEGFIKEWSRDKGGRLREWWPGKDGMPAEVVKSITGWDPAVVLIAAGPAEWSRWLAHFDEGGLKAIILDGGEDLTATATDGTGREVLRCMAFTPEGLTEAGKQFAALYEKRFGEPPNAVAAAGYDAARLLLEAVAKGGESPDRIRAELKDRAAFESLTGPVTWKDGQVRRTMFIVQQMKERPKVVRTVTPE